MKDPKLYSVLIVLLMSTFSVHAQHEYDQWYFGAASGIRFDTGNTPVPTTGPFDTQEGCIAISDSLTGELLFTSDGRTVFDKTFRPMPNGFELRGGYSSAQSALVVPVPNKRGRFLLFTVGDLTNGREMPGGFVNEVNLLEREGLGDVTLKNSPLLDSTAEKLAGTRACNWNSYWVVMHHRTKPLFYAYLVTENGVTDTIISEVGEQYTRSTIGGNYGVGCMKFSRSGEQLAMTTMYSSRVEGKGCVELFDFNLITGKVSNPRIIAEGKPYYGVSFAPDNSQMFITTIDEVLQLPMSLGSQERSLYRFRYAPGEPNDYRGGIQLGPDGRVYISNGAELLVIESPTDPNATVSSRSITLNNAARTGLPIIMDCMYFKSTVPICSKPIPLITSEFSTCEGLCLQFTDASKYNPKQWRWSFEGGNPSSSTLQNPPPICYSVAGEYTVTLEVENEAGVNNVQRNVNVSPVPKLTADSLYIACANTQLQLSVSGADRYVWTPPDGLNDPTSSTPVIANVQDAQYVVQGFTNAGCTSSDTVIISALTNNVVTVLSAQSEQANIGDTVALIIQETIAGFSGPKEFFAEFNNSSMTFLYASIGSALEVNTNPISTRLKVTTVDSVPAAILHFTTYLSSTKPTILFSTTELASCKEVIIEPSHTLNVQNCASGARVVTFTDGGALSIQSVYQNSESQDVVVMYGTPNLETTISVYSITGQLLLQKKTVLDHTSVQGQKIVLGAIPTGSSCFVIATNGISSSSAIYHR